MAQRALHSGIPLDPRLQGPLPLKAPQQQPMAQMITPSRTVTPPQLQRSPKSPGSGAGSVKREISPQNEFSPPTKTNSSAQNIPSISSLVHAENSISVISDNKSNSSGSRAGSRSPKENVDTRATDIPHDKLNIMGEDQRAIRVLDRKFCI